MSDDLSPHEIHRILEHDKNCTDHVPATTINALLSQKGRELMQGTLSTSAHSKLFELLQQHKDPIEEFYDDKLMCIFASSLALDIDVEAAATELEVFQSTLRGDDHLNRFISAAKSDDFKECLSIFREFTNRHFAPTKTMPPAMEGIAQQVRKKLYTLLIWGPTTHNRSTEEDIAGEMFNHGIVTVTLRHFSAHGINKGSAITGFFHDMFHFMHCHNMLVGSLVSFTLDEIHNDMSTTPDSAESDLDIDGLVNKHCRIARDKFNRFMTSMLNRFMSLDPRGKRAFFYAFHEAAPLGYMMFPTDWTYCVEDPDAFLKELHRRIITKRDGIKLEMPKVGFENFLLQASSGVPAQIGIGTEFVPVPASKVGLQREFTDAIHTFVCRAHGIGRYFRSLADIYKGMYDKTFQGKYVSSEDTGETEAELKGAMLALQENASNIQYIRVRVTERFFYVEIERTNGLKTLKSMPTLEHLRRCSYDLRSICDDPDNPIEQHPANLRKETPDKTLTFLKYLQDRKESLLRDALAPPEPAAVSAGPPSISK